MFLAPPRLEFDKKYFEMVIPIGGMIKLNIDLEGSPPPVVTWYHDGGSIKGRRRIMIDTNEFMSTFIVKRAIMDDAGEYRCVAKNEWGTAEATFDIRVMGMYTSTTKKQKKIICPLH